MVLLAFGKIIVSHDTPIFPLHTADGDLSDHTAEQTYKWNHHHHSIYSLQELNKIKKAQVTFLVQ
jgi:hypothetical protein